MLTVKQQQIKELFDKGMGTRQIGRELGIARGTVQSHLDSIKRKENAPPGLPQGFNVYQQTTHVQVTDEEGVVKNIWHRSAPSEASIEEFVKSLESRVEGKAPKIQAPKFKDTDLSVWLPIGDPHFGQYSWSKEVGVGEDYDVEIASELHFKAIQKLLSVRDRVDCIYICSLGDLFHADSRRSETEKSKHLLDTDGRYLRVVDETVECLTKCIDFAATKAKQVKVILVKGNHDKNTSPLAARILAAYYRKSKHIEVDTSPSYQTYVEYGNNLIGLAHGDAAKMGQLAQLMSCDQREAWGRTRNHYWFTGHIHQQKVFEYPSCVVESFNSLTAKDAYAAEYGYRSRRQMTSIVIHKEHGEVERAMVRPEHFE